MRRCQEFVSAASLGFVSDDGEVDEEEGEDGTGVEVEGGTGATEGEREEREGVTVGPAMGDEEEEEEDFERGGEWGDLGAEEEEPVLLEDVVLLSKWWRCW